MAIEINFTVLEETLDPKQIVVGDLSDWGVIIDSPATISVTPPGFKDAIVNTFFKNEINVITAKGLRLQDINCNYDADLPDGVYKITIAGTPDTYNKTRMFIKVDKIKLRYTKFISSLYNSCKEISQLDKENVINVLFLIEAAKSQVILGNWCTATEAYEKANKLLDNLDCKRNN